MADCAAIGDSIALGIAPHAQCYVMAAEGRRTAQAARVLFSEIAVDTAIISLGSNDHPDDPKLLENMREVRKKISARRVIWLMPYHRATAWIVEKVAAENRDGLLDLSNFATKDGVHPANYRTVAREALRD